MMILQRLLLGATMLCPCSCSSRKVEFRSAVVPSRAAELATHRGLVDVRTFIPDVAVDLRYASSRNIARRPLYPPDMPCLLLVNTAKNLKKAQAILRKKGFGLRVWDAWRPPEAQLLLAEKEGNTGLFLDPRTAWSRHCSGTAVDVTLVDEQGVEQVMPTDHDAGGATARSCYTGGDPRVKRNLQMLQAAMTTAGFRAQDTEWWHFDDNDRYVPDDPIIFGHQVGIYISDTE